MTDDKLHSVARRELLTGLGTLAIGGVAATLVGREGLASAASADAYNSSGRVAPPSICVFDVNETLLDIEFIAPLFQRLFGDRQVLREWFAQLVLYSGAITLSGPYTTFFTLGQGVLKMLGTIHHVSVQQSDIEELRTRMLTMPAHPDVPAGLKQLKEANFRLVTLTNSGVPHGCRGVGCASFGDLHGRRPCMGHDWGSKRWLLGSTYRPVGECPLAGTRIAPATGRRARSARCGHTTDQALALSARGKLISVRSAGEASGSDDGPEVAGAGSSVCGRRPS
jgi:hypothetical protein